MQKIKYNVIETEMNVEVFFRIPNTFKNGSVSANIMKEKGVWWIARALVKPESLRSKGFGSEMLKQLKSAVIRQGGKQLVVCPGGYDEDKKKQFNFYLKNGFVHKDEYTLTWSKNEDK